MKLTFILVHIAQEGAAIYSDIFYLAANYNVESICGLFTCWIFSYIKHMMALNIQIILYNWKGYCSKNTFPLLYLVTANWIRQLWIDKKLSLWKKKL